MREELITFETAKLAEEKGCKLDLYRGDWEYEDKYGDTFVTNKDLSNCKKEDKFNVRPSTRCTQSLLQRWLREQYAVHIEIIPDEKDPKNLWHTIMYPLYFMKEPSNEGVFKTYEEALEKGLYESLKLI